MTISPASTTNPLQELFGERNHPFLANVQHAYELARYILEAERHFPMEAPLLNARGRQTAPFVDPLAWSPMPTHQKVSMKLLYPQKPNKDQWKMAWIEFPSTRMLEDFKAVIESADVRFQWDPAIKQAKFFESYGRSVMAYSQVKGFWPVVGDRDLSVVMSGIPAQSGQAWLSITHSVEDSRLPPNQQNVRAFLTLAAFLLEYVDGQPADATGNRLIRLSYLVQSDPRGMIPDNILTMLAHSQAQCVANIVNYVDKASVPPQTWCVSNGQLKGLKFNIKANQLNLDIQPTRSLSSGSRLGVLVRLGTSLESIKFDNSALEYVFYRFAFHGHHFVWVFIDMKSLVDETAVFKLTLNQTNTRSSSSGLNESPELEAYLANNLPKVQDLWWNAKFADDVSDMLLKDEVKQEKPSGVNTNPIFSPEEQQRINELLSQYSFLQSIDSVNDVAFKETQFEIKAPVLAVSQWLALDPMTRTSNFTHPYLMSKRETISEATPLEEPPVLVRMGVSQYKLAHKSAVQRARTISALFKQLRPEGAEPQTAFSVEWWRLLKWIQLQGSSWKTFVIWQPNADVVKSGRGKSSESLSLQSELVDQMKTSVGFIVESADSTEPISRITLVSANGVRLSKVKHYLEWMQALEMPHLEYPLPQNQDGEHEWKHCLIIQRIQLLHKATTAGVDLENPLNQVVGVRFHCSIQQHPTVSAPRFAELENAPDQPWVYYHMLTLNFAVKQKKQRHIRIQSAHSLLSAYVQCVYKHEKVYILFSDMKNQKLENSHDHSLFHHPPTEGLFPMDLEIDAFYIEIDDKVLSKQQSITEATEAERFDMLQALMKHEWVWVNGIPIHTIATFKERAAAPFPEVKLLPKPPVQAQDNSNFKFAMLIALLSFLVGLLSQPFWSSSNPAIQQLQHNKQ